MTATRCDRAYAAFEAATDLVAVALPDAPVTYEWPGTINVQVANDILLVFGIVNETLGGNVCVLRDDMWDEAPGVLATNVSSDTLDPQVYANEIVARVRRYQPGDSD